ncbi:MAG: rho-type GTPase-activating protein 1 [Linnemannia gamsii]|nr:MAG: rho-type GTPase-activating protein 1 [Linnemannia gamsii]
MPHQLPQDQQVPNPAAAPMADRPPSQEQQQQQPTPAIQQQQQQQQHQQQQQSRSSRDLATPAFPQQTDQPRLRSLPIQTSPIPPRPELAPAVQNCGKCELQMQGSFVRALGATYHLDCFKCLDCDEIVASKFFPITESDDRQYPLCERDYFRRLNMVCHSCGEALRGSYITALDRKYHIEHFTCSVCPTVFGPQDSYYEHDGMVYCHYHYSLCYATKCAGCRTAILKQFVEINRNSQDEHWHPECYMIHKFWNVKLSFTSEEEEEQKPEEECTEDSTTTTTTTAATGVLASRTSMEQRTPEELKRAQQHMEEKVYQIWTVLSAFEESSAGCISEMLLHVSNGSYYDGVQMAEKFILHVEILFSAIDDLETQMKEVDDKNDLGHGREAKMLCKKIINFFSLLSHTQESGVRRLGMTQELLSLVTGLAHYLKILIRIALTCALKLEHQYNSTTVIARFLNKLMELANKDKCLQDLHGKGSIDAEVTSDLCLSCRITIEDECFTFDHHHRWHPKCLVCSGCNKPLASVYYDASFDANRGSVYCQQCKTPESGTGFSHVTKLEQYTFLLRVALIRLENLLHLKGDESEQGLDQRGRHLGTASTANPLLPPGVVRKDSRSKSYSSDDNRQYEPIHLGDIKRVKSTHLDRKLSNSARIARRQTVIEHQRRRPPGGDVSVSEAGPGGQGHSIHTDPEVSMLEFEIIDESEITNDEDDASQVERRKSAAPVTLSDLTDKLRISAATNGSPSASLRARSAHGSTHGSQHLQIPSGSNGSRKRQYLNELSALELFIVKHLAVLMLAPVVSEYFTPEELLDLIGQRKQTLWGRFVKGLKTDKKKSKVEGTFGVPLELLVERNGVDSALGAGPGRIRIPSFIDDSISAMRNMDMSVEGIFRKSGNIRRQKELSEAIDKDPALVSLSDDNPVQVAALLKKFLRELPDPLLTFKLHRLFIVSQKMEDEGIRKMILHLTCCLLPKANRDSMEAICLFLRWVASFSHVDEETGNKMDLHNLATVITPNVLYSKSKDPMKDESFLAIEAVMGLLEYQDDFCVVPEDLSLILSDQDLVESSTDLSSKDILKRCENLVKAKVKKSHSVGDLYQDHAPSHSNGHHDHEGVIHGIHTGTPDYHYQAPGGYGGVTREVSVPVMIQQPGSKHMHHNNHHHSRSQNNNSHHPHGLSTSNPSPSTSSSMGPMRIPERLPAVAVDGGKGSTPMSL